jgi:YHS domain-containing protein
MSLINKALSVDRHALAVLNNNPSAAQTIEIRGFRLTPPFPLAYDGSRADKAERAYFPVMRFLIWLVVLCWTVALLRRAVVWMLRSFLNSLRGAATAPSANQEPKISSRRLVRDPVCGVHIAEERAIPLHTGSEIVYFCSIACRDQYARREQRFAANG